jgi:putative ABC transport system substrate-binding protein
MPRQSALLIGLLVSALFVSSGDAQSIQSTPLVGFLSVSPQSYQIQFFNGLCDLGFIEGRSIVVDRQFAGTDAALSERAQVLVASQVDVIVATSSSATAAAMRATTDVPIPIVMVTSGDPINSGFIDSFRRPGGHVTGLTSMVPELSIKMLEMLIEVTRDDTELRLAILYNPANDSANRAAPLLAARIDEINAAGRVRIEYRTLATRVLPDIVTSLDAAAEFGADTLLVVVDPLLIRERKLLVDWANAAGVTAIYPLPEFVQDGGLMSYGAVYGELYYRAAQFVDQLLDGRPAGDMPVQTPNTYDRWFNRATAERLGKASVFRQFPDAYVWPDDRARLEFPSTCPN